MDQPGERNRVWSKLKLIRELIGYQRRTLIDASSLRYERYPTLTIYRSALMQCGTSSELPTEPTAHAARRLVTGKRLNLRRPLPYHLIMLGLFIDTCVWINMAERLDGQQTIVPLRVLLHQKKLTLYVPQLVIDEFDRNRPHVEATLTAKVRGRFRELRADIHKLAHESEKSDLLDAISYHLPLVSAGALQNFREVAELLQAGNRIEPTSENYKQVVQRGLSKRAPLHRANKNSVADALLIEMFASLLNNRVPGIDRLCFVTSNHEDFSAPNADHRDPHPDLAELFASEGTSYAYEVEGLRDVLMDYFGDEFAELSDEVEDVHTEPRTLAEILEAEQEYFDKVWYVRSLILDEKIESGEHEPLPQVLTAQRDEARRAIEERYGSQNVGPWDDWEWGFVHGKLSALRWVLGEEWDFLDT